MREIDSQKREETLDCKGVPRAVVELTEARRSDVLNADVVFLVMFDRLSLNVGMTSPATQSAQPEHCSFTYKAFLSYSHKDERRAERLHRQLERYRIPKNLRTGQSELGAIFRDKDELSAASELDASIQTALRASENLIVLCSPNAVGSQWVDKEIAYFKSLGREDRIFTVLLSGTPYAEKLGFDPAEECFPKSIRYDLTETGGIAADRPEPLATDLRPGGDGEKLGVLKLVSGLLGLGLDQLLQRQLLRARRRLMGVLAASSVLISVFAGLAWATHSAQKQAEARQADAEDFVEFLLSDLSLELEALGRLDLLDAVGGKTKDYYAQFDEGELSARASGRHARALHFMGELQNSLAKTEQSEQFFEQAYALTEKGLSNTPGNPDRVFEHARSAYLKSLPLRRKVDYGGEVIQLAEFAELSQRLYELENGSPRSTTLLALANMNMGRVKLKTDAYDQAGQHLSKANALFENLNEAEPNIQTLLHRAETLAWLAEYHRKQDDFELSYEFRTQQSKLIDEELDRYPDDFRLLEASVYAKLGLANAANLIERIEEAKDCLSVALSGTQKALQLEPRREKMRRAQSVTLLIIMRTAILEKDRVGFQKADTAMKKLQADPLTTSIGKNKYWDEVLPESIEALDSDFD